MGPRAGVGWRPLQAFFHGNSRIPPAPAAALALALTRVAVAVAFAFVLALAPVLVHRREWDAARQDVVQGPNGVLPPPRAPNRARTKALAEGAFKPAKGTEPTVRGWARPAAASWWRGVR